MGLLAEASMSGVFGDGWVWCASHHRPCREYWACPPPCDGCGYITCLCAALAATVDCETCDNDQVIITCTECEDGEVWDEDGVVTCPACQGAYSIPCPDCDEDEG
jgi:hypothetical protein